MAETNMLEAALQAPAAGPQEAAGNRWYVFAWGALALAAAAYLGAITMKPKLLVDFFPSMGRTISLPQGNDGQRAAAVAEADRLRNDLAVARKEAGELKQLVAQREAQMRSGELRVAGLEKELQETRKAAAAQLAAAQVATPPDEPARTAGAAPAAKASTTAATSGKPVDFEMVNADVKPTLPAPDAATNPDTANVDLPLPARRPVPPRAQAQPTPIAQITRSTIAVPGVTLSPAPNAVLNPIETGSVAAPQVVAKTKPEPTKAIAAQAAPVAFGSPIVTKSASPVGIRLTAGPSVDALRLSWSLMSERHGAELSSLQPRYVVGSTPSAPFALIAGPLTSSEQAKNLCASLVRKGIPCSVDTFTGNAL